MKVLMIGLGSIGQRHLRNLTAYLGEEVTFLAYRVRGQQRTFADNMQIREGVSLEEEFSICSFSDLDEALAQKPKIVYVTTVTGQHIPCAIKAVQAGCDVFLEKPVSHDLEGVKELIEIAKEQKRVVFVGFQNRYHPCLKRLKEVVSAKQLGAIISVQSEMGERLTTMHAYENYADTYMARRDQGGGVILNQQIHELDYIQWIFGEPVSVVSFNGKNGTLQIDVEDYCDSIYWVNGQMGSFPIYAHADFFQYPPKRRCKVIFENGWAEADLQAAVFTLGQGDQVTKEEFTGFQRNQMFIDEMKDFLDCVRDRRQTAFTLDEGVVSLKMALAAKKSAKDQRTVMLNEVKL